MAARINPIVGAAIFAMACATSACAADIYKCGFDDGSVTYTDTPCKGGDRLDIQSGAANAEALERLDKARDALDRSADRRLAAMQRNAELDRIARATAPIAPDTPSSTGDYTDYAYDPVWYPPLVQSHPRKTRHRPPGGTTRHVAPAPPYIVPRL